LLSLIFSVLFLQSLKNELNYWEIQKLKENSYWLELEEVLGNFVHNFFRVIKNKLKLIRI